MRHFLFSRIVQGIIVLAIVISLTFILMRMAPGSPFSSERALDPKVEQQLMKRFNLNGSTSEQLLNYWRNLFKGDMGDSLKYRNRTVEEIFSQVIGNSLTLGFLSMALVMAIGIPAGCYAAVHHMQWQDRAAMFIALLGICLPTFLIAPLFILIFAIWLEVLPVAGWGEVKHLFLPVLCLALPYSAYCARLMRTSMLEVLGQDYVRTARAKGLNDRTVVFKHALKNAILPIISYSGPLAAHVLTGSLVIEEIFKIPGMGTLFVNSVLNRDIFLVGGCVIVYSSLLIALNILVDILYTMVDKRIKLS